MGLLGPAEASSHIEVVPMSPIHGPEPYCGRHCTNMSQKDGPCPKELMSWIAPFINCHPSVMESVKGMAMILSINLVSEHDTENTPYDYSVS
ncbi:unnamed protein product [Caretta caretta]